MSGIATNAMTQLSSYAFMIGLAVAFGLAAANLKALPLAYTFRILPSLYRLMQPRLSKKRRAKTIAQLSSEPTVAALPALFEHHVTTSRAIALDLDINVHKSNSTFFSDADISRAALLTTLLSQSLANLGPANFILAGVQCKFGREIRPFQAYAISTRVLAWNEKSLYMVTYFLKPRTRLPADLEVLEGPAALLKDEQLRRNVFATMITKYVFKAGRTNVSPEDVLRLAGLLISENHKRSDGQTSGMMSIAEVKTVIDHGLEYVRECMV